MPRRFELVWVGVVALGGIAVGGAMWPREGKGPAAGPRAWPAFVNFETPQVHPIDMTPDGLTLLVCNTADNRVEVYSLATGTPVWTGSVSVGLDPVSVRARTATEVWVVNHVSDSVSIVDLTTMNVVRTVKTLDEPCDVVFAGDEERAFVSCSQVNTVQVFDPADPGAAPINVPINAEDPRSLAVSPDGQTVYAAVFESGNGSTLVAGGAAGGQMTLGFPPNAVDDPAGPYGGVNPPPNAGTGFEPPIAPGNLPAIGVGMIVKKDGQGRWMDDNDHDWTSMISGADAAKSGRVPGWDLPDRDLAAIDAGSLSVTYATGLMNLCIAVAVNPATGAVTVVGTDGTNEIRFEPNISGTFIRVQMASINAADLADTGVHDLNAGHLDYSVPNLPQSERDKSIGDPRAIVWTSDGATGFVAGLGSNNVIVIDESGQRAGFAPTIEVGEGPTGLALDEARDSLYVLNRFAATISVVNLSSQAVVQTIPFFDPTPAAIKAGRKHLYGTHENSGLGHISCASCHVDARMDRLAWDLGDPSAPIEPLVNLNLGFGVPGLDPASVAPPQPPFAPHHPMKGPMTTQTLQHIIGLEPHHWRGDRAGLEAFAPAFKGLQGDDAPLDGASMQEFEAFLATIHFPPNPFRNFDNTLPSSLPLPGHFTTGTFGATGQPLANGDANNGMTLYRSTQRRLDAGAFACVTCHTLPTGAGPDRRWQGGMWQPLPVGPAGEHHVGVVSTDGSTNVTIKVPQFRNAYEKVGCNFLTPESNAGFGYVHDGSVDSIERFITEPIFTLASDQEVADLTAFILCLSGSDLPEPPLTNQLRPPGPPSQDVPASVGAQLTLAGAPGGADLTTLNAMIALADASKVGLVARGRVNGEARGYSYLGGGNWQSDRAAQQVTTAALQALAAPGNEMTYTVVPEGSETRIGIDRDLDGCLDGDEGVTCDCLADLDGSGSVDGTDADLFLDAFALGLDEADVDGNGFVNGQDFDRFVERFGAGC